MKAFIGVLLIAASATVMAQETFLESDEIALLSAHPDVPGVSRHVFEGKSPSNYDKIIVGSVGFYFSEKSKAKDMDADEMKQVSDAMKAAIVTAATGKADVVLSKGANAALLNVAITEIQIQNKKRGLLGYTPIGLVVTTAGNLTGMRMQLKDAQIEGELVDSVTGERISVFRVEEIVNWDDKKGLSWEDLRASFELDLSRAITASRTPAE